MFLCKVDFKMRSDAKNYALVSITRKHPAVKIGRTWKSGKYPLWKERASATIPTDVFTGSNRNISPMR